MGIETHSGRYIQIEIEARTRTNYLFYLRKKILKYFSAICLKDGNAPDIFQAILYLGVRKIPDLEFSISQASFKVPVICVSQIPWQELVANPIPEVRALAILGKCKPSERPQMAQQALEQIFNDPNLSDETKTRILEMSRNFAGLRTNLKPLFPKIVEEIKAKFPMFKFKIKDDPFFFAGKQEGKAEGRAEGLAEGKAEERKEMIRKLSVRGFSVEQIAEMLELNLNEVRALLNAD